jgi:hypothetical protein
MIGGVLYGRFSVDYRDRPRLVKPMRQGYETGKFGSQLAARIRASAAHSGWHVYYDHGDPTVDASVAAIKGFFGTAVTNLNRLADIDILIASPDGIAQLLIEIEESPSAPKKILGDILAVLFCNQFAVRVLGKQRTFRVSPETRLTVAGVLPDRGYRLRKIDEVIRPRLQQLEGFADGISPKNVQLVFSGTIAATLKKLDALVASQFGVGAA